jgi:hypothetical protein
MSMEPVSVGRAAVDLDCDRVLAPYTLPPTDTLLATEPPADDNFDGMSGTLNGSAPWLLTAGFELSVSARELSLSLFFLPFFP